MKNRARSFGGHYYLDAVLREFVKDRSSPSEFALLHVSVLPSFLRGVCEIESDEMNCLGSQLGADAGCSVAICESSEVEDIARRFALAGTDYRSGEHLRVPGNGLLIVSMSVHEHRDTLRVHLDLVLDNSV